MLGACLLCGVVSIGADRRINAFNSAAAALLGIDAGKVVGQPLSVLPAPLAEGIEQTLASGQPLRNQPVVLPGTTGQTGMLCLDTIPAVGAHGKPNGAVVLVHDLALAQELEGRARRLEQLASIGILSASLAHEVKNALVPLKTFLELLLIQNPGTELAGVATKEMRRLDAIVSQMLRFATPAQPTFAPVRVHELLDHSVRAIQHQLAEKQIAVRRNLRAHTDTVHGDPYQLEQALLNLLLNALEAMEPDGVLTLTTELVPAAAPASPSAAPQPQLSLKVQDTGAGVAAENLGRLFEPFFTTKPKGTGLGLAITRQIIQDHNGQITVQSEPRRGTTFSIVLPLLPKA